MWSYPVLVGLPLAGLAAVLAYGARHLQPLAGTAAIASGAHSAAVPANTPLRIPVFLAQIVVVIGAARLVGRLLRRFGQPQVVGEMLAGLILGPSILGAFAPTVYDMLFPAGTVRFLNALSQVGLLLFMFLVGLELDGETMRGRGHAAVLISHVSIVTPLFLGAVLALALYPQHMPGTVSFTVFALFVGTALSVTAFPVLARILTDCRLDGSPFANVALSCAAVDDVTAWCLLAAITRLARPETSAANLVAAVVGVIIYTFLVFTVGQRFLRWIINQAERDGEFGQDALAAVIALAFTSAWVTDWLGVHALFGAFIAGVAMPKHTEVVASIRRRSEDLLIVLLLPLFFASTGIRTNVTLLQGSIGIFLLTIFLAVAGKLGGGAVAARAAGYSWRDALALGSLLNARGLVGLVVIGVGLDLGVISSKLYAMLILMALVTTFMAAPMVTSLLALKRRGTLSGAGALSSIGTPAA